MQYFFFQINSFLKQRFFKLRHNVRNFMYHPYWVLKGAILWLRVFQIFGAEGFSEQVAQQPWSSTICAKYIFSNVIEEEDKETKSNYIFYPYLEISVSIKKLHYVIKIYWQIFQKKKLYQIKLPHFLFFLNVWRHLSRIPDGHFTNLFI